MQRRELVLGMAATASAALAGCTNDGGGYGTDEPDDDGSTDAPSEGTQTTAASEGADSGDGSGGDGTTTPQVSGDPDGEIIGGEGLAIRITEYDHEVRDHEPEIDQAPSGDYYFASGTVENDGEEMVSAEIMVSFYDDSDTKINSYNQRVFGIGPGETGEFEAGHHPAEEVARYTLEPGCVDECPQ